MDRLAPVRLPARHRQVRLTFILRRGRKVDPDNALAACKALIDGLTDEPGRPALLPDDSAAFVEYAPIVFETGKSWRHCEEVMVLVEACGS